MIELPGRANREPEIAMIKNQSTKLCDHYQTTTMERNWMSIVQCSVFSGGRNSNKKLLAGQASDVEPQVGAGVASTGVA